MGTGPIISSTSRITRQTQSYYNRGVLTTAKEDRKHRSTGQLDPQTKFRQTARGSNHSTCLELQAEYTTTLTNKTHLDR